MKPLRMLPAIAGLGLSLMPLAGNAASIPLPSATTAAPAAVERAATELAQACRAWPTKDQFPAWDGKKSLPIPLSDHGERVRALCTDATTPSTAIPTKMIAGLFAFALFALYGFALFMMSLFGFCRAGIRRALARRRLA